MAVNWGKGLSAIWNGITTGDFSQPTQAYTDRHSVKSGNVPTPVGSTYRGLGSSIFNANDIALEDWQRQEQSNILSHERQAEFNAIEAEKSRDWQEYMSNTSYQRMVADMKKAGINPIMAFGTSGADIGQSSTASVGSTNTKNQAKQFDSLSDLLKIVSGLVLKKPSTTIIKNFNYR